MSNWESREPCTICGIEGDGLVCEHHLLTRKAFPELQNEAFNRIPVCLNHHNLFHCNQLTKIAEIFPQVKSWLINNDWYICEFSGKWRNNGVLKKEVRDV